MRLPRLSIRLHGGMTAQQCVDMATLADTAGLAGICVCGEPVQPRHPAGGRRVCGGDAPAADRGGRVQPVQPSPDLMAMEIGALDEPRRGGSVRHRRRRRSARSSGWVRLRSRAQRGREAIVIVRALLRGEEVTHKGRVFAIERIRLDFPARADIPIYTGGTRRTEPARLRRAGGWTADVEHVRARLCGARRCGGARRRAGGGTHRRNRDRAIPPLRDASRSRRSFPAEDGDRRDAAGLLVAWSSARMPRAALLEGSGLADAEIEAAVGRLRAGEDAAAVLDDRYVDAFALAGTAQDCRARAERFAAAGVTELAVTLSGPDVARQMKELAAACFAAPPLPPRCGGGQGGRSGFSRMILHASAKACLSALNPLR